MKVLSILLKSKLDVSLPHRDREMKDGEEEEGLNVPKVKYAILMHKHVVALPLLLGNLYLVRTCMAE